MGRFSKLFRGGAPRQALFTERELEFNREKLQKAIVQQSAALYEYRNDAAHQIFETYVRQILNLEMLQALEGKLDAETYAYRRGRVDSLRNLLNAREVHIQNTELLRKSKSKSPDEQAGKRSYVRAPSTQAGLSI